MPKLTPALTNFRAICLSFPDTKETLTWGKPHFRVGEKIFAGFGEEEGRFSIGFKLEMDHARAILRDRRFKPAPYVGHKGWVSMDVTGATDWDQVRDLVEESYELIAPKKSLAKLIGGSPTLMKPKKAGAKRKASPKRRAR